KSLVGRESMMTKTLKTQVAAIFFGMSAILIIFGAWTFSSAKRPASPSEKKANIAEMFQGVHSQILEIMKKSGVPSVVVAVAKNGETIWEESYGWADREKEIEATPGTIYHLASISKSMTATGLMILKERGLVDLNEPANTYLGETKLVARIGDADQASVKRILFHTAGLPMHWNFFDLKGSDPRPNMEESIKRYGVLITAPGETYTYSNFGYGIIDHIISRISGKDYADFMKEEVFIPLGMKHTSVQVDASPGNDIAVMYDEGKKPIPPYDFDHRGASAVLSTAGDMIRFGMFHMKKSLPGQNPILKAETVDRMHTEIDPLQSDLKDRVGFDYLLGSFGGVSYGGYRIEATTGSMPGAVSRLVLVPSENIVSALLSNGDNIDLWQIEKLILEALLPDLKDKDSTEDEKSPGDAEMDSIPPDPYLGIWSGSIETYTKTIPVRMTFPENGKVRMEIDHRPASLLSMKTPLGEMGFQGELFKGIFMGQIRTPDTNRSPHVVLVECRCRGDRLTGYAAAVAMNKKFCLPHWIDLTRETGN
ncbi:MAG: beta-lactamase family protein, partial [Candidatus Aminicenantes bacterium]|nr:beta-lactamase family protein [Candidatus Aminicenantes bacterium]